MGDYCRFPRQELVRIRRE